MIPFHPAWNRSHEHSTAYCHHITTCWHFLALCVYTYSILALRNWSWLCTSSRKGWPRCACVCLCYKIYASITIMYIALTLKSSEGSSQTFNLEVVGQVSSVCHFISSTFKMILSYSILLMKTWSLWRYKNCISMCLGISSCTVSQENPPSLWEKIWKEASLITESD